MTNFYNQTRDILKPKFVSTCDVKIGNTATDINYEYSCLPINSNKNLLKNSGVSAAVSNLKSPVEYSAADPVETEISEALNLIAQSKKAVVLSTNMYDPRCKIKRAKSTNKSNTSYFKNSLLCLVNQDPSPVKNKRLKIKEKSNLKILKIFNNSKVKSYS